MIYKKLLMILTVLGSIIYSGYPEDTILSSEPPTQKSMEPSFLDCTIISQFISSDYELESINSDIHEELLKEKKITRREIDDDEKTYIMISSKLFEFLKSKLVEMFEFLENTGEHLDSQQINLMLESFDRELKKEEIEKNNLISKFKKETLFEKCDLMKVLIKECLSKKIEKINSDLQRQVQNRINQSFCLYNDELPTSQMPLSDSFLTRSDFPNSGSTGVLPLEGGGISSAPTTPMSGGGDLSRKSTMESLVVPGEATIEKLSDVRSEARVRILSSAPAPGSGGAQGPDGEHYKVSVQGGRSAMPELAGLWTEGQDKGRSLPPAPAPGLEPAPKPGSAGTTPAPEPKSAPAPAPGLEPAPKPGSAGTTPAPEPKSAPAPGSGGNSNNIPLDSSSSSSFYTNFFTTIFFNPIYSLFSNAFKIFKGWLGFK